MKRLLLIALLLSPLPVASCAPKTANVNLSPAGQIAYTADQIVLRVNELQQAAITANSKGILDTGTTRLIVNWSINADMTLKVLPQGWKVTVQTSWTLAKKDIHTTNSIIQSAMAAVDAVLGGI